MTSSNHYGQPTDDGYRWALHVIEAAHDSRLERPGTSLQPLYHGLETPDRREHGGPR